jgi:hypothetical protein
MFFEVIDGFRLYLEKVLGLTYSEVCLKNDKVSGNFGTMVDSPSSLEFLLSYKLGE